MIVSFVSDAFDKNPTQVELSWDEFRQEFLSAHDYSISEKNQCPAFCPVQFREGGRVENKDAIEAYLGVLDLDELTGEELDSVQVACDPYEYVIYTTFSHSPTTGKNKARVVLPLSRPVLKAEWPQFWLKMAAHLGGKTDPRCKNISRIYFLPYAPVPDDAEIFYHPGEHLNPDTLIAAPSKPLEASEPKAEDITDEHLEALYRLLKRRGTAHSLICAKAVKAIRQGLPFAESGARDDTLFKLISEIDRLYPNATSESVSGLLAQSLSHMAHEEGAPTQELVQAKLLRAKETRLALTAAKTEGEGTDLRTRILEAFRGLRDSPYTLDEAKGFASDLGIPWEQFRYHWLYQKGNAYYVRVGHDLRGPKLGIELSKVATTDLSPAITLGVDPYTLTKEGTPIPKSPAQLMEHYGTRVDTILASMVAQKSTYVQNTGTLIEAVCPLRELNPAYDPEVETWLRFFAGDMYEKLLDWLTLVPDLSQPLPALYIKGGPGDGKSLFGESLARLWTTTQATPMEALSRSFNSMVASCPVVFADEYLPDTFRGDKGTGRLRAFIAERQRMLSRKFMPDTTLEGCIRLVLAGNNDELIKSEEHLTDDDIKAIIDRIIYFETSPESAAFLKSLPDLGDSIRYKDRLAKHVWHLAHSRQVGIKSRFGVESEAGKLHRKMTVGAGPRSIVCNWLCGALLHWDQVSRGKAGGGLRVVDGKLWVNSSYIVDDWARVNTNAKPPPTRNIGMAIAALSENTRQKRGYVNFRVIKTDHLIEWAEETGYASKDQILEALAKAERREDVRDHTFS